MSKKESERFLSSCFHVRGVNKHASRYWARLGPRRCSSRALETAVRSRRAETAPSGQMSLYVVSGCLVGTGNRRDTNNRGVHRGQAWNRIDRYARARHESFRQKGVEMENGPTSGRSFIKKRTALFSATFNRATTAKRSGKMIEVLFLFLSFSFSLFLLDDGLNDDVPGNRRRESKNSDAGHRNGGTRLYYGVWSKTVGPSHRQFLTVIRKNQPSRPRQYFSIKTDRNQLAPLPPFTLSYVFAMTREIVGTATATLAKIPLGNHTDRLTPFFTRLSISRTRN